MKAVLLASSGPGSADRRLLRRERLVALGGLVARGPGDRARGCGARPPAPPAAKPHDRDLVFGVGLVGLNLAFVTLVSGVAIPIGWAAAAAALALPARAVTRSPRLVYVVVSAQLLLAVAYVLIYDAPFEAVAQGDTASVWPILAISASAFIVARQRLPRSSSGRPRRTRPRWRPSPTGPPSCSAASRWLAPGRPRRQRSLSSAAAWATGSQPQARSASCYWPRCTASRSRRRPTRSWTAPTRSGRPCSPSVRSPPPRPSRPVAPSASSTTTARSSRRSRAPRSSTSPRSGS